MVDSAAPAKTDPSGPSVIALLGAKGGVGTTTLTANLAIYLATIGKQVIAVDADPRGSDLGVHLGITPPLPPYAAPGPAFGANSKSAMPMVLPRIEVETANMLPARELVEGPIPRLRLLNAGLSEPFRGSLRRSSLRELRVRVGKLNADYIVVDLGAAPTDPAITFWCRAMHKLFVTVPEPNAVSGLYREVRKAFARHSLDRVDGDAQTALQTAFASVGQMPAPLDIATLLRRESPELAATLVESMRDVQAPFVVNQARLRADLELGDQIGVASRRRYGVRPRYLGYVEHDDTVRSCVRKGRPLLLESPGSRASRNIEKIARRLFATKEARPREPWREVPPDSHHDVLEVERGATDEEIRRAYKRMCAVFDPDNIAMAGLLDPQGIEAARARIDESYDVLLDPARRRPYELSIFPEAPPVIQRIEEPDEPEGELPPPPTITPETEFSGAMLRAVRRSQGTALKQISERTKVGTNYLRCIEDDDYERLPAAVYVRGFVTEFAKCLKLDPEHVSRSYLRRYKAHFAGKAASP